MESTVVHGDLVGREVFREANQEIALLAHRFAGQDEPEAIIRFVCECADRTCIAPVRVTLVLYQEVVRSQPRRFLFSSTHSDVREVVEMGDGYQIIVPDDESKQVA